MNPLIEQWIAPGTHIMSDGWHAYDSIQQLNGGYLHDVVNHRQNFVHPHDDNIHTQSIESLWKKAKKKLRNQSGTNENLLPSYLKEFMWRQNVCHVKNKNVFSCILSEISLKYLS